MKNDLRKINSQAVLYSSNEDRLESDSDKDDEDNIEMEVIPQNSKPRERLSEIIFDYYHMLQILENYRILNEIAARKILKKFHKARGFNMEPLIKQTQSVLDIKAEVPKSLLKNTEELYVKYFSDGDLKQR